MDQINENDFDEEVCDDEDDEDVTQSDDQEDKNSINIDESNVDYDSGDDKMFS